MTLSCDYSRYGRLCSLIPEMGGVIDDTRFGEDVVMDFHMEPAIVHAFHKRLADATNGQVKAEITGEKYFQQEILSE